MAAQARQRPVPLEAGLGPENPPCPACGEPLFGWTLAQHPPVAVRRCESCGLGVIGEPGGAEDALAELDRLRVDSGEELRFRIANRSSLQASLGGGGWSLLHPGARYLFTLEAVRRLVASRDQHVARARWLAGPSLLGMWATLVNGFTFGRNLLPAALGRATAEPARRRWQRWLDRFVCVVVALPVLLVAAALEGGAALARRGGLLELTVRPA